MSNDKTEALPPLEQQIDEYIDGYTLEGDDGYYTPNDTERMIAKDVAMGLLAEPWFVAALAAAPQAPQGADRWVVVRETVLDVGLGDDVRTGGRPELGYALIAHAATYASQEEAAAAIRSVGLPIGWVYMPLSRLLPDVALASPQAPQGVRCEWCCGTGRFADHACRFCAGKSHGSVFAASPQAPAEQPVAWRDLYRRAINEANGLTNYVEDRPELRSAERRLAKIEEDARTLAAQQEPNKEN